MSMRSYLLRQPPAPDAGRQVRGVPVETGKRDYWIELSKPDGRISVAQWVNSADGYGTLSQRLTQTARMLLSYETAGSTARVYAGVPIHANPLSAIIILSSRATPR